MALYLAEKAEQFLSAGLIASTFIEVIISIYGVTAMSDIIMSIIKSSGCDCDGSYYLSHGISITFVTFLIAIGDICTKENSHDISQSR